MYLEEVNVTEDQGVIKKIIRQGEEGPVPAQGEEVHVHYEGRLEDGTVFDSSYERNDPIKINIGTGQVIKGWDSGIMTMKLNEKADLVIQSDYGYGDAGSPPKIPGGATLIFTVELVQIGDRTPAKMSDTELLEEAKKQKEEGNNQFKAKKFDVATGHYAEAIQHLGSLREPTEESNKLKVTCHQNMSVCLNNNGNFSETVVQCTAAIAIDEKAAKAFYLRGVAHMKSKNFDEATEDLKHAIKLNPQDKKLRAEFEVLKTEKKKFLGDQQAAMQKMFTQGLYNEKSAVQKRSVFDKLPDFDAENVQTFFDMQIGEDDDADKQTGRVIFEVFSKQVPKTAENFRAICTGEKGEEYHYKSNIFHRVIKGFMAQGGDITAQNGTGGHSIYGHKFEDEQIWFPHTHKGVLSMANAGPDTNGSQFFICFGATPHLNEKHTIFGRVIKGYDFVEKVEANPTAGQDLPVKPVKVVDCGELKGDDKLNATNADFLSNYIDVPMNLTDMHTKEHEDDSGEDEA